MVIDYKNQLQKMKNKIHLYQKNYDVLLKQFQKKCSHLQTESHNTLDEFGVSGGNVFICKDCGFSWKYTG